MWIHYIYIYIYIYTYAMYTYTIILHTSRQGVTDANLLGLRATFRVKHLQPHLKMPSWTARDPPWLEFWTSRNPRKMLFAPGSGQLWAALNHWKKTGHHGVFHIFLYVYLRAPHLKLDAKLVASRPVPSLVEPVLGPIEPTKKCLILGVSHIHHVISLNLGGW